MAGPARKSVVALAWELMQAEERKAKKAKPQPEASPPAKKPPMKRGKRK